MQCKTPREKKNLKEVARIFAIFDDDGESQEHVNVLWLVQK